LVPINNPILSNPEDQRGNGERIAFWSKRQQPKGIGGLMKEPEEDFRQLNCLQSSTLENATKEGMRPITVRYSMKKIF